MALNVLNYRDMVVLNKSETELQVDIVRAQSKLISFYGCDKWLGITSKYEYELNFTSKTTMSCLALNNCTLINAKRQLSFISYFS